MILKSDPSGQDGGILQRNVSSKLTNGMRELRVNSMKFWNMDRLNHQVKLAMIRYGCTDGVFDIGEMYEVDGTVKLILR
jgi:hypothetical protein